MTLGFAGRTVGALRAPGLRRGAEQLLALVQCQLVRLCCRCSRNGEPYSRHFLDPVAQWQDLKPSNVDSFLSDQTRMLLAIEVFGMGIDKSDIRYVVHMGSS